VSRPTYDLTVHGPNGFLRQFKGSIGGGAAEVEAKHGGGGQLRLTLTNGTNTAVRLTVTDGYHKPPAQTYLVGPRAKVAAEVRLDATNNWYDASVVSEQDAAFLRRLAGHVETGRPSTSDPAIG